MVSKKAKKTQPKSIKKTKSSAHLSQNARQAKQPSNIKKTKSSAHLSQNARQAKQPSNTKKTKSSAHLSQNARQAKQPSNIKKTKSSAHLSPGQAQQTKVVKKQSKAVKTAKKPSKGKKKPVLPTKNQPTGLRKAENSPAELSKNAERRKVMELQKELDSLNRKTQKEVALKDAEGRSYCQEDNCDQPAVTDKYCRYHYLNGWKYRRNRSKLLESFYLTDTIQNFLQAFGEGALHLILRDCKNEKTFEKAGREMNFFAEEEEETIHPSSEEETVRI